MKINSFSLCLLLSALFPSGSLSAQEPISLAGLWDLAIGDSVYADVVELPGSLVTNGKGTPISTATPWTGSLYDSSYYHNPFMRPYRRSAEQAAAPGAEPMKLPFFLTPATHYVGNAWYRRTLYLPAGWRGKRAIVYLERPHIETTLWVNGKRAGHNMSLSTPHQYDVTDLLLPGQRNEIVVKVYNGIENVGVGQDSHSVTDQTQGNWNGIAGLMELQPINAELYVRQLRVYPDAKRGRIDVKLALGGNMQLLKQGAPWTQLTLTASVTTHGRQREISQTYSLRDSTAELSLNLRSHDCFYTWDEFFPTVYTLTARIGQSDDVYQTTFGLRSIEARGRQLYINERPLFLRGTVENCCFPETGYPPTEVEPWLRIFRQCRRWGLNHVRFHSYCPPEAAFIAADRVGIYLQVEGPSWPNHGVRLRRGQVIDTYLMDESRRIIDAYGNHPSFVFMAAGNEPAGDWVSYCNDWVAAMTQYDPTKLYCGASVGGGWAWDNGSQYHVKGGARGLDWDRRPPQSDDDYYDQILFPRHYKPDTIPAGRRHGLSDTDGRSVPGGFVVGNNSPIVAHEQGQWCAFPDLKETAQYTGAYKAYNFDIFRDLLKAGGMETQAEKFLMASGRLQTLCYKYEVERNLRTPDYAGFQLLGLNDYSGQGTALVGPLNVHWREKGYATADDWTQFCSPFVPLARFPRFVFNRSDTLRVPVEAYNALWGDIEHFHAWYVVTTTEADSTRIVASGSLVPDGVKTGRKYRGQTLPIGKNIALGTVHLPLAELKAPAKYTLAVYAFDKTRQNSWDFWVYPDPTAPEVVAASVRHATVGQVYVTDSLDSEALAVLQRGGRVLVEAAGKVTLGSDVSQTYLPVFWNTSWFKMRPPHTTGAYIDSSHPLFRLFPTDAWSNLNWWELLNRAQVMNLQELPATYQPPIQPIDTWHVSRKLAMLVEANVLGGRLVITTMDLTTNLRQRPAARQMRRALMAYMEGDDFRPTLMLTPDVVQHFFTRRAAPVNMFTRESPDELKPKVAGGQ
ncbi:MAG: beta-glucuronidase [Prevotella sp.]|nr:beta-glucuronidase [Prevotella sp.]